MIATACTNDHPSTPKTGSHSNQLILTNTIYIEGIVPAEMAFNSPHKNWQYESVRNGRGSASTAKRPIDGRTLLMKQHSDLGTPPEDFLMELDKEDEVQSIGLTEKY